MRSVLAICTALCLVGCAGRTFKVDNPVVGPPPPRVHPNSALADGEIDRSRPPPGNSAAAAGAVVMVSSTDSPNPKTAPLEMTDVAAQVNGRAILVGDVLVEFRTRLDAVRQQMRPEQQAQFRSLQLRLLKEHLPSHIEQALMVEAVKQKLKPEQLEAVNTQLDQFFDEHIQQLQEKLGAASLVELEIALQQQGLSLPVMRKMFGDKQLAEQYMSTKLGDPPHVSRAEMLAAYKAREAEFTEPEQIRWQQIQLSFKKYDGREGAQAAAAEVLAQLREGADFGQLARQYSDGPDAAQGGRWDWTETGSLASELRTVLEELPPGQPSDVVRTGQNLQIVQVLERRPARVRPFAEVQNEIHRELVRERQQARVQQILAELRASAVISTILDDAPDAASAGPADARPGVVKFSSNSADGG